MKIKEMMLEIFSKQTFF